MAEEWKEWQQHIQRLSCLLEKQGCGCRRCCEQVTLAMQQLEKATDEETLEIVKAARVVFSDAMTFGGAVMPEKTKAYRSHMEGRN